MVARFGCDPRFHDHRAKRSKVSLYEVIMGIHNDMEGILTDAQYLGLVFKPIRQAYCTAHDDFQGRYLL